MTFSLHHQRLFFTFLSATSSFLPTIIFRFISTSYLMSNFSPSFLTKGFLPLFSSSNVFLFTLQMHQLQCREAPLLHWTSRYLTSTRTTSFSPGSHPALMELHMCWVIMWKSEDWPESHLSFLI